jgi:D-glycero-D-manno-heptose 1,7-bisphosphate phosphatase
VSGLNLIKNTINLIVEAQLNGKFVCVATNQQGLGKGLISWSNLDKLHNKINKQIIVGGGKSIKFYVCPHLETDDCVCRKPKPGLILQALRDFNVEKKKVIFIGDQLSDELAAIAAGVDFYYINRRE